MSEISDVTGLLRLLDESSTATYSEAELEETLSALDHALDSLEVELDRLDNQTKITKNDGSHAIGDIEG